jgi:diaminopimelate epimerase
LLQVTQNHSQADNTAIQLFIAKTTHTNKMKKTKLSTWNSKGFVTRYCGAATRALDAWVVQRPAGQPVGHYCSFWQLAGRFFIA